MHEYMAFRADEESEDGRRRAFEYLITRHLDPKTRPASEAKLHELIDQFGPVVEAYPSWHPLVSSYEFDPDEGPPQPRTTPGHENGYQGLDHTIYLRQAFITCPYGGAKRVIEAVDNLKEHPRFSITAEQIDEPLYMPNATPVLVKCKWFRPMERDGTIPKSLAVPLMLEQEVPGWRKSKVAETWETMSSYILGLPRGSRSSLFVNQETGQALKSIYTTLIYTGMYGPIYVG